MNPTRKQFAPRLLASLLSIAIMAPMTPSYVFAQPASGQSNAPLSQQQLSSLVAPIALYPDPLVSQILMASTYPLEVGEAATWQKQNSRLTGSALDSALQSQTWDPSVKSLVSFPQALQMMGSDLSWTQKLGDAVLAQQSDVMSAIQSMRAKAKQAGNLATTPQQTVSTSGQTIVIQPANPQVVYVPTYNPSVVYGPWPYPAYPPPPPYYPPGYEMGTALLSFGVGMAVGAALWGGMHWGGGWGGGSSITVNNNNFNNFNRTTANANFKSGSFSSGGKWQFNPEHRGNVPYSNSSLQNKYGKLSGQTSDRARDQERDQLRQNLQKNGLSGSEPKRSSENREPSRQSSRDSGSRNEREAPRETTREPERETSREPSRESGERLGGERIGGFRK
ncbi:DUF3300 domain-containing protein [Polynucleobacter wuianus]|uniref:DUF3300 domain-containing protein n=1 Tax=Polynucleobacter wuianus TaxID=1743168 RepID=UPI001C0DF924|nr:DUF3300 domain-containing protein [Polynucleobacter wuianus]MBU3610452.1 DUF3300 domain-containing protein [Polynucleobacter wuianus]